MKIFIIYCISFKTALSSRICIHSLVFKAYSGQSMENVKLKSILFKIVVRKIANEVIKFKNYQCFGIKSEKEHISHHLRIDITAKTSNTGCVNIYMVFLIKFVKPY